VKKILRHLVKIGRPPPQSFTYHSDGYHFMPRSAHVGSDEEAAEALHGAAATGLLADHPDVRFTCFVGGIGTCEAEMHRDSDLSSAYLDSDLCPEFPEVTERFLLP